MAKKYLVKKMQKKNSHKIFGEKISTKKNFRQKKTFSCNKSLLKNLKKKIQIKNKQKINKKNLQ